MYVCLYMFKTLIHAISVNLYVICALTCVEFTCRDVCDLLHLVWGNPYVIFLLLIIRFLLVVHSNTSTSQNVSLHNSMYDSRYE